MSTSGKSVLLAIPARGGSKRLRRKNLLDIGGKPMLVHTIEAALRSELSDNVYVCTEDDEIAAVAGGAGANVFRIPPEMAEDDVSSTTPVLELLKSLEGAGTPPEYIFNLQPTSPLRTGDDIAASLRALTDASADFLVSVTSVDPHYFHWAMAEDSENGWAMYFGKEFLKERIYLPDVFRPNGAIKLAKAGPLKQTANYFGQPMAVYEMPEERSIHVATEFDLTCARAVFEKSARTAAVKR